MFKVIIYKRLYEKWYENENSYILKSLQGITFNTTKVDFSISEFNTNLSTNYKTT